MRLYPETKDPSETKDYTFDWTARLAIGEALSAQVVDLVDAGGTSIASQTYADGVSRVFLSGGTHGARAVFTIRVSTDGGRTLEEAFGVDIVDTVLGPVAETNIARLNRYLAEAKDALHKLATGVQIVDLWHDGRRRRYVQQNVSSLTSYITWLEGQIESETAAAQGRPRRRAIALAYRN